MTIKNLWKGALLGTLALPLVAFADSMSGSSTSDQNINSPSDRPVDPNSMDKSGIGSDTSKSTTKGQGTMNEPTSTKEVTGTISKVDHHQVWLKSDDGTKLTLQTDSDTKVYKPSGATEKITELKEGQQVRASYNTKQDKMHALRIDVMSSDTNKTKPSNDMKTKDQANPPMNE